MVVLALVMLSSAHAAHLVQIPHLCCVTAARVSPVLSKGYRGKMSFTTVAIEWLSFGKLKFVRTLASFFDEVARIEG